MARANRHFLSGYVWHITQRCHKKEFLLKFAKDRQRWIAWLFEAKKRYGLDVLNYTVTSPVFHNKQNQTKGAAGDWWGPDVDLYPSRVG